MTTGQFFFGYLVGMGVTMMVQHSILEHDIKRWERARSALEAASRKAIKAQFFDQDAPSKPTMSADEFWEHWRKIDWHGMDGGEDRP